MIRVASVPAAHPYVEAVTDPERVALLPDPVPPGATLPGQWWPPRFLDPGYLATRLDDLDLMHVHFGFDSTPPAVLREVTALLAAHRIPLVVTVHDLDNPHFADSTDHRDRLGVLIGAAAAVITLTAGAAREIERTWSRTAIVLPHPHVLPIERVGAERTVRAQPVVALHGKGLRANIDPWPVLDALVPEAGARWRLRLDLDQEALTSARSHEVTDVRLAAYRAAGVDVRVHPRFSDAALGEYLTEIDVLVLPYRSGTHSGWIEACYDAGVCAVVPDCGHFGDQQAFPVYGFSRAGLDVAGLVRAVDAAVSAQPSTPGVLRRLRRDQRTSVRDQTVGLYQRLLGVRFRAGALGYWTGVPNESQTESEFDKPVTGWRDIPGWFQWRDGQEEAVAYFPDGSRFVEVGVYLGRSLCSLAEVVAGSGRDFSVLAVDTCRGSGPEGVSDIDAHARAVESGAGTMAGLLHRNVIACGFAETVQILISDSIAAAAMFPDASLAWVHLDARHDYESVTADIAAWLPKVAPGGWLSGDDYDPYAWPGVVDAVRDALPEAAPWSTSQWRLTL